MHLKHSKIYLFLKKSARLCDKIHEIYSRNSAMLGNWNSWLSFFQSLQVFRMDNNHTKNTILVGKSPSLVLSKIILLAKKIRKLFESFAFETFSKQTESDPFSGKLLTRIFKKTSRLFAVYYVSYNPLYNPFHTDSFFL